MLGVLFPSTTYISAGSSCFFLAAFVYLKYNTFLPAPHPPSPPPAWQSDGVKMSRDLIATDKNPHGGIKKKKAIPTPPVCLSCRTLIILNKPRAAQLTIRKPCLLARGIDVIPPHHRQLHVLPILAAAMDAGRRDGRDSNQPGNRGFGKRQPSPIWGLGYLGPPSPWAHLQKGFWEWDFSSKPLLFPSRCYLRRASVSSQWCFSPQRGKHTWVMMNVWLRGSTFVM